MKSTKSIAEVASCLGDESVTIKASGLLDTAAGYRTCFSIAWSSSESDDTSHGESSVAEAPVSRMSDLFSEYSSSCALVLSMTDRAIHEIRNSLFAGLELHTCFHL
jgi:hypothetical protein